MSTPITREKLIELLNEDLAREYQAIIAYTVYSQTMKGAAFTDIFRTTPRAGSRAALVRTVG